MSFEDRLRRSLQSRADDVTPDPAMYSVVQSRIRRARTFRLALAGAVGTLALAGVALAATNLNGNRIEFEPAPVASQPEGEVTEAPTETEAPTVSGTSDYLVFTDGEAVYGAATDGESAEELIPSPCPEGSDCDMEPVRSVAARPSATSDGATVIAASNCGGLGVSGSDELFMQDTCPTSVTFSPDGQHVAWVGQAGPTGDWILYTADWTGAAPGDATSFGLEVGSDAEVRIEDWIFTNVENDAATGILYLRVAKPDDTGIYGLRLDRQGDGALAVPSSGLDPVAAQDKWIVPAYASGGGDFELEEDRHYRLELRRDDASVGRIFKTVGPEGGGILTLPDEFRSRSTGDASDLANIWMSAAGDSVLFGDGLLAWMVDWSQFEPRVVPVDIAEMIVHADLVAAPPSVEPAAGAAVVEVDVYFGMTGADACVADQVVQREVESPAVARGALTELLEGPSPSESNEGVVSPFNANTSGSLREIVIVDGEARVDFADFSDAVDDDSCTKSAIVDSLDKTLLQFPTITSTRYAFDSSVEAWESWLGRASEELPATPPAAVVETQKAIYDAAVNSDWQRLRSLSRGTSCTLSDQPEPCVPYWKEQEANGKDPLGVMVDLINQGATRNPEAPIWVYPPEWADANSGYSGPRIGIDEKGKWRYFVLEGG